LGLKLHFIKAHLILISFKKIVLFYPFFIS
jgi:hypothetical protein